MRPDLAGKTAIRSTTVDHHAHHASTRKMELRGNMITGNNVSVLRKLTAKGAEKLRSLHIHLHVSAGDRRATTQ